VINENTGLVRVKMLIDIDEPKNWLERVVLIKAV